MQGDVLSAVIVNVSLAVISVRTRALTISGTVVMGIMGFWIYLVLGWRGFLVPISFFALGSIFTRLGYDRKSQRGTAEKGGGRRGAREVLANGLVPLLLTVPILAVDARLFTAGFVGAWAAALCDTSATELGGLWGRRCVLLRSLRPVPAGTPGAVSLEGTAGGFAAALVLASISAGLDLISLSLVIPVAAAALVASLLESLLASALPATFAYKHESQNIFNTAVGGLITVMCGISLFSPM